MSPRQLLDQFPPDLPVSREVSRLLRFVDQLDESSVGQVRSYLEAVRHHGDDFLSTALTHCAERYYCEALEVLEYQTVLVLRPLAIRQVRASRPFTLEEEKHHSEQKLQAELDAREVQHQEAVGALLARHELELQQVAQEADTERETEAQRLEAELAVLRQCLERETRRRQRESSDRQRLTDLIQLVRSIGPGSSSPNPTES